jgi:hypothetical protein
MTGTIFQIWGKATNCLIKGTDGVTYWSHVRDFPDPTIMKENALVEFRPKLARIAGKHQPVTDVIAA